MESIKSLDTVSIFTSLLSDVSVTLGQDVYTIRDRRLDGLKAIKRTATEGAAFLTKQLPRLGKSLDRALIGDVSLDYTGFQSLEPGIKLPKFLGKLFMRVFSCDGWVLQTPCTNSIKLLRNLLFVYYKYELPNKPVLDQKVLSKFEETETDLLSYVDCRICHLRVQDREIDNIIYGARARLKVVFRDLIVGHIVPRHGPGSVSTKEIGPEKYVFRRYNQRIAAVWPWDEYFYSSLNHFADSYEQFRLLPMVEASAKVILVPKDSRGPRLISSEPLENQWIQGGLAQQMKDILESHEMTRGHVNFKDQEPNRQAALQGSLTGNTCTLDLAEASDRVSVGLVKQLFPEPLLEALLAARSTATTMPDGRELRLTKYAPMGSALCFPVLASVVWAVLSAGLDAKARKGLLVYGDDVIVPTASAGNAMRILEAVGLKVNRDKSCTSGFFRESCGMDAYRGSDVTPVRIRTVWSHIPSAKVYTSYLAYANSLYARGYVNTAYEIATSLVAVYKSIPYWFDKRLPSPYPALAFIHPDNTEPKTRTNRSLQKREQKVLVVVPKHQSKELSGYSMLLRWFTEGKRGVACTVYNPWCPMQTPTRSHIDAVEPFRVREYTQRGREKLRHRWR